MMLESDLEILHHAQRLKDAGHLKFDADAAPDSVGRRQLPEVPAIIEDLPARRLILAKDQAEERALACAVRSDQAVKLARLKHKVHVRGDLEAAEALVELAGLEERHHAGSRAPRRNSRCGRYASARMRPSGASNTVTTSSRPITTSAYWLP